MGMCLHVYLYTIYATDTCGGQDTEFPVTRVKDNCEPQYLCRELNPDHLEEKPMLLTTM